MAAVSLRITQPAHGAYLAGSADVRLLGQLQSGSAAGLFFRWYSTLNPAATKDHPELNAGNHAASALDFSTPLDLGSHVITLAAADRDGSDMASLKAVTQAGFTGGAPGPANRAPCVVHRLLAVLKQPADGQALSKAAAKIEMRAPLRWAKETAPGSKVYVRDSDYSTVNGIRYRFHFAPDGAADPAKTADVIPPLDALVFSIESDNAPYLTWQGALPANLGTGAYVLTLYVESADGAVSHSVSRKVSLS